MEKEIKFLLNYTTNKRDIKNIKTDYEKSGFNGHICVSFKVLDKNREEVSYSKFAEMTLEEIKENNYSFTPRNFFDENLSTDDYGVLKEKISSNKFNFYIIKIKAIGELQFAKHSPSLEKEILDYVEVNMERRKNYKAKYIFFDANKNNSFEEDEDFGNGIKGIDIMKASKLKQVTLKLLPNPIVIN